MDTTNELKSRTSKSSPTGVSGSSDKSPFEFLAEVEDSIRFQILTGEHPAVIATVLSFLPTRAASETLNRFEPELRVTILRRMCQIESFDQQEVARLSAQLKSCLQNMLSGDRFRSGGVGIAKRLLSCADTETQESLIECLNQQDPELARELKQCIFQFSDLIRLSNTDVKMVLKWVDTALWAPALKNASPAIRKKVLLNMAVRPREILNREIQTIGNVELFAVNQAQSRIVATCIRLAEKQLIALPAEN